MCNQCEDFGLELDKREDKLFLLNIVRRIALEHPWYYLVGPMSDEERVFYDLQSELRNPGAKK